MAGPTLKRMMPRARGRADRILKRSCHLRIILDTKEDKKTEKTIKKAVPQKVNKQPIPTTESERPIADKPNTQKPLGTKAVTTKKVTGTGNTAAATLTAAQTATTGKATAVAGKTPKNTATKEVK
jgi:hypothetical protein